METESLKAFVAVAEENSFSEAAEVLHLTQPAVSKRIAALENLLDAKLFDRIGRQVSLTEAGRALLPRARQILREVGDARRAIDDLSGDVSGRLSLVTSHHVGLHRLPPVLRQFTSQYKNVSLDIDFLDSEQAYEAVLHGQFDLAVVTLSPQPHEKLHSESLWGDPLYCVVGYGHELASRKKITLADLSEHPAILPKRNTYTTALVSQLFDQQSLPLTISLNTNYLETIKMMVSIGLGWSWLPETLLDDQLQTVSVEGVTISRHLGVIYHKERTLSNAAKAFMTCVKEN
ncbi:MAG: LysR family transcriptional regulator [Cellvibrionaceae bacterium]